MNKTCVECSRKLGDIVNVDYISFFTENFEKHLKDMCDKCYIKHYGEIYKKKCE